jgi:hypothetical protein
MLNNPIKLLDTNILSYYQAISMKWLWTQNLYSIFGQHNTIITIIFKFSFLFKFAATFKKK